MVLALALVLGWVWTVRAEDAPTIESVSFQNVGSPPTQSVVDVTVHNASQLAMVAKVEVEGTALDGTEVWGTSSVVGPNPGQTRIISVHLLKGIIEVCFTGFVAPTGVPQE